LESAGCCAAPDPTTGRHRLLEGLDDVSLTLRHAGTIDTYEARRPDWLPVSPPG
jgi:3-isopropylmalate dehydratase small subunit